MKPTQALVATGALTLALAGCSGESSAESSSSGRHLVDGQTFTTVLGSDPGSLNPQLTSQEGAFQVDRFLYDSLLNVDEKGALVPGLASAWHSTPTSVTYTLRKGVTCSDGTPLTARDVADNINFVANPANGSSRLGVYVPVGTRPSRTVRRAR